MTCAHEWRVEYVPVSECRKCRARQEEADAYRRGVEAMRFASQEWCRARESNGAAIADALADLRVEDKP
jgi:hypothetical protein